MKNKREKEIELIEDFQDISVIKILKEDRKENYFSAGEIDTLYD